MNNKRHTQTIIIIALLLLAVLTGLIWWLKAKSVSIPVNDADTSSIRSHTPEPAASSAIQIFQQYVSYLKGLDDLRANYGSLQMQTTQAGKLDIVI